ncbi:MAG TPA: hypothetical protein VFV10_16975, partial [Gammaproteobacteria bacterium]|nr:hypothetical protein [Gammaproteobacteria bacterium]
VVGSASIDAPGIGRISSGRFGAYEVDLASRGDALAVAWYDTRDGNAEIYLRLMQGDAFGARSREYRLTDSADESYEASIDALADGFAVAWYEKSSDGKLTAELGLWIPEHGFRWRRSLGIAAAAPATPVSQVDAAPSPEPVSQTDAAQSPPGSVASVESRNPVVRAWAGRVFCAWIEKSPDGVEVVRGRWFEADGTPSAEAVTLGPASATTWNLNAAIDRDGAAVVVYDATAGTKAAELYATRLEGGSTTLTRLTADDGYASKYPDLAFGADGAALTWFDERDGNQEVYLYVGKALEDAGRSGASVSGESLDAAARRITNTAGHSIGAYVASSGGRYGLAWSDDTAGSYEIYFQSFSADGAPEGSVHRLTSTPAPSLIPAIRPYREGFAIAWTEVTRPGRAMHDASARAEIMLTAVP